MFACVHIPEFLVQAVMRGEPKLTLRPHGRTPFGFAQGKQGKGGRAGHGGQAHQDTGGQALALLDGVAPQCRVVAASAEALRAGIEIGMAKAQVEQFAGVEMRMRSPEQERNAHAALLDLGGSFSPRVEDTAPESIVLDLAGLDALFGDAESIARRLAQDAWEVCGMAAHVAVASNPDAALHAARAPVKECPGVTVIAEGEEAARLGPLSIGVLGASVEAQETFERWGVRTCAALAALPALELSERLGAEGVRLHEWARGAGQRSLRLAAPALSFEEALELDYEVAELEPLAFLLSRLLESLCARLEARSLAAAGVRLRLTLAPQARTAHNTGEIPRCARNDELSQFVKCLNLPVPLRNAKLLLNLLRLQLQGDPPGVPVRGIFLAAEPARPRATQSGLFVPSGPDPEKLELTLAKLAHLVGESRVGSPELVDTHRPDAFRMRRFSPATAEKRQSSAAHRKQKPERPQGPRPKASGRPELQQTGARMMQRMGLPQQTGFRVFRPALAARVEMSDGRPARVFFCGLRGTVVAASGPWRGSGDWWEKDAWQQEEWDLEIEFSGSKQISQPTAQPSQEQTRKREARRGLYRFAYNEMRRAWMARGIFD